jgi:tRNA dimethylallyltransferase
VAERSESGRRKPKFAAIIGPTATGKSKLALNLARQFGGEIISADSVQVYRGLDIGTAKPSPEERRLVPHHLIDILDPGQDYSAAIFRDQADEIIQRLDRRKTPVFVVGGTGLYLKVLSRGLFRGPSGDSQLRALLRHRAEPLGEDSLHQELQRFDPDSASRIHPQDTLRIIRALEVYFLSQRPISQFQREHGFRESHYEVLKIGLLCERDILYRRIESRVDAMIEMGWVEEVESLLVRGYSPRLKSMQSLGYRSLVSYLEGEMDLAQAIYEIKRDTRRYAKRQLTWFKADREIHWFTPIQESSPAIEGMVSGFFHQC